MHVFGFDMHHNDPEGIEPTATSALQMVHVFNGKVFQGQEISAGLGRDTDRMSARSYGASSSTATGAEQAK